MDDLLARYRERVAAAPDDVREYRLLASACLVARELEEAGAAVESGLALTPHDPPLIASRGEVKARRGDPAGALTDWRRALELDPEDIGLLYSTAFLLERERRPDGAIDAWR